MGRLAAQQAATPPTKPANPDSPYVRVVDADAAPPVPPKPPSLRSRSRRASQPQTPAALAVPGPNTRIVNAGEDAARPGPSPVPERQVPEHQVPQLEAGQLEAGQLGRVGDGIADPALTGPYPLDYGDNGQAYPTRHAGAAVDPGGEARAGQERAAGSTRPARPAGRPILQFDATDDLAGFEAASGWADVPPSPPDRDDRSRTRPVRPRSSRRAPTFRTSGQRRRGWAAGAAAAGVLIVAVVIGFTLAGAPGSHGRHPASGPTTTAPAQAVAPVAPAPTSPTTMPATALLVASSAGSSTYRVDASATITFRAGNGSCWVEIRQSGPDGPVMFTGDLTAGQSRDMNGPVWVRLGNPGVIAITVNGTSISPPGMTAGQPYDLQFA
jgi:hypothetical protein